MATKPPSIALRFTLGLCLISTLVPTGLAEASETLDIKSTLARPGVRLLAVDVYATWCAPCMKAMDRWRELRAKYRDQGLRIVMVHTQDPDTQCGHGVSDFADDVICDPKGYVANWLRVRKALPAAFLWSWQGNMLVRSGHVDRVEDEVERYFKRLHRVSISAHDRNGKDDLELLELITSEMKRTSKFTIVATDAERKELERLQAKSFDPRFSTKSQCELGQALAANTSLQARLHKKQLSLKLLSIESHCLLAQVSIPYQAKHQLSSVSEAVDALLDQVRRPTPQMPKAAAGALKTAGFGQDLGMVSIPEVEQLAMAQVDFDPGELGIDFLERWQSYTDRQAEAARKDTSDVPAQEKVSAWKRFLGRQINPVPSSMQGAYEELRQQAKHRISQWEKVAQAESKSDAKWRRAKGRFEADRAKLRRFLALKDRIVPQKQKRAYQAEFDAAYAPFLLEQEKRKRARLSVLTRDSKGVERFMKITVDGLPKGSTPYSERLRPGSHLIKVGGLRKTLKLRTAKRTNKTFVIDRPQLSAIHLTDAKRRTQKSSPYRRRKAGRHRTKYAFYSNENPLRLIDGSFNQIYQELRADTLSDLVVIGKSQYGRFRPVLTGPSNLSALIAAGDPAVAMDLPWLPSTREAWCSDHWLICGSLWVGGFAALGAWIGDKVAPGDTEFMWQMAGAGAGLAIYPGLGAFIPLFVAGQVDLPDNKEENKRRKKIRDQIKIEFEALPDS